MRVGVGAGIAETTTAAVEDGAGGEGGSERHARRNSPKNTNRVMLATLAPVRYNSGNRSHEMKSRAALLGLSVALCTSLALAKPPAQKPQTQTQTQSKSFSFSFGTGKGRLGTNVVTITEELRQHFGAPADAGLLVSQVEAGTPAANAGVKVGDVITRVDGDVVTDTSDVANALSDKKKGDVVTLVVVRNKRTLNLSAKLDSDADDAFDFDISIDGNQILKKAPSGQGWQWNFTWPPAGQQKAPSPDMKRFQERLKKLEKKYKSKPTTA